MTSTVYIAKNVYGGDGLGRLGDGRVVFVPGAWAGESVKAEIKSLGVIYKEMERILANSSGARTAVYTIFGRKHRSWGGYGRTEIELNEWELIPDSDE